MAEERKITFSLKSIHEENFVMKEESPVQELRVYHLMETEIHPLEEKLYVRSGIRYSNEEDVVLCECVIGIQFGLEDFNSVIHIDEDSKRINFSSSFIPTFLNMTYGTLRAVLFEKVKDTYLSSYPLPPISMQELEKLNHFRIIR